MELSYRESQKIEHPELIGSTRVSIEPHDSRVDQAVQILTQKRPDLLQNVTTIKTDFHKGSYGEFSTGTPNTVYVNLKKIEEFVRNNLQGQSQEEIDKEIVNQVALTIAHESGHMGAVSKSKNLSEQPAEQVEQEVRQLL